MLKMTHRGKKSDLRLLCATVAATLNRGYNCSLPPKKKRDKQKKRHARRKNKKQPAGLQAMFRDAFLTGLC